eukprot:TRINITY_DN50363_c0_g1_i2.p1 TRINITY_DN50363_c0_g1~~TRINITY_DN50363_c0_g1_i2.p1  ORF type:complete len:556 (-),score=92.38 TRINITY_DN50363_c0_g1_i2:219-1886(-)
MDRFHPVVHVARSLDVGQHAHSCGLPPRLADRRVGPADLQAKSSKLPWPQSSPPPPRALGIAGAGVLVGALLAGRRRRRHRYYMRQAARCLRASSRVSAHAALPPQILIIVGSSTEKCPWGEPGNAIIASALGYVEPATWLEAMGHLAAKLRWAEQDNLDVSVEDCGAVLESGPSMSEHQLALLVNTTHAETTQLLEQLALTGGSGNVLILSPVNRPAGSQKSQLSPREDEDSGSKGDAIVQECEKLWTRNTAEDALYAVLFAIQYAVSPVRFVAQQPAIDTPGKIWTLCTRCLKEALAAAMDKNARACLACQNECDPRDQTQMYRCTVSYESEALASLVRAFERRGIFDCGAEIPTRPQFTPLASFRGEALTEEMGWQIMEGHLRTQECSWRPVLGQNPAYDYFPCQFNTWYDPVFKVVTFSGAEVWRTRHYRVQVGDGPGDFYISTEDNGISLREHWRIVDADDDLKWAVFHYAGAAASVGQSYSGSLLVTPDGMPPPKAPTERICDAFRRSGVESFELYSLRQDGDCFDGDCGPPPLTDVQCMKRYRGVSAT